MTANVASRPVTRSMANMMMMQQQQANGDATLATDVEMRDANARPQTTTTTSTVRTRRNGETAASVNGISGGTYRGINRYLQDLLQSAVGNLPELVYKISRERGTTNEQALRFLQDEITRLVTRASTEVGAPPPGPVSNDEVARLRAIIEKDRETIEALEAEVNVVKRIFAKNKTNSGEDRRRVAELQAKVCRLQQELRRERRKASRIAVEATEASAANAANVVAQAVNEARASTANAAVVAQPNSQQQQQPQSSSQPEDQSRYYDEARAARLTDELQRSQAELNRARDEWQRQYEELRRDCERERREMNDLRAVLAEQRRRETDEHRRLRDIVQAVYPDASFGTDENEQFDRIVNRLSALLAEYQASADSHAELMQIRDTLQRRVDSLVAEVEKVTSNDTRFAQMIALIRNSERDLVAAIRYREEVTNERMIRLGHVRQRLLEQEMILGQLNLQDVEDPQSDRLPANSLRDVVSLRNTLRQECRQLLTALGIPDTGQCSGTGLLDFADATLRSPSRAAAASRAASVQSNASSSSSTLTAPSRGTTAPTGTPIRLGSALSLLPPNMQVEVRGPVDQEAQRNVENLARSLNDARLRMTRIRTPEINVQLMLSELNMYVAEQQQLDNALRRVSSVRSVVLPYEPSPIPAIQLPPSPQRPPIGTVVSGENASAFQLAAGSSNGNTGLAAPSPFVPIRATPDLEQPPDARVIELLSNVRRGGSGNGGISVAPTLSTIAEQTSPTYGTRSEANVGSPAQAATVPPVNGNANTNTVVEAMVLGDDPNGPPDMMRFEDIVANAVGDYTASRNGDLLNLDDPYDGATTSNNSNAATAVASTSLLDNTIRTPVPGGLPPTPGASLDLLTTDQAQQQPQPQRSNFPSPLNTSTPLPEQQQQRPSSAGRPSSSRSSDYDRETAAAVAALEETIRQAEQADSSGTRAVSPTQDSRPSAPLVMRRRRNSQTRRESMSSVTGGGGSSLRGGGNSTNSVEQPLFVDGARATSRSASRASSSAAAEQRARNRSRSRSPLGSPVFLGEQEIPSVPTPQSIDGADMYEFEVEQRGGGGGSSDESESEYDEAVVVPPITF